MKLAAAAARYAPLVSPELSADALAQLIVIARQKHGVKNTDLAGEVLKAEARKAGVDSAAFAGKTFYTENGTGVFISSRPIGSGNRTAIAVREPGGKMRVVTGCFRGRPGEMLESSDKNHGIGTVHNAQYREFLAEAFRSLPRSNAPKPNPRTRLKVNHFQRIQKTAALG